MMLVKMPYLTTMYILITCHVSFPFRNCCMVPHRLPSLSFWNGTMTRITTRSVFIAFSFTRTRCASQKKSVQLTVVIRSTRQNSFPRGYRFDKHGERWGVEILFEIYLRMYVDALSPTTYFTCSKRHLSDRHFHSLDYILLFLLM